MWGPGPWTGTMWGFWWIFPVIGLMICLFFAIAIVRTISTGGRFMCMGSHQDDRSEIAELRKEVRELREQMKQPRVG